MMKQFAYDSLSPAASTTSGSDASPRRLGYQSSLDGFRGISILMVMAYNGHLRFGVGGFIGVDLFFVLSGFLITSLLSQEWQQAGRISLKRFYARRALRLLPALSVLIVFCCAYALLFREPEKAADTYRGALFAIFYVANWTQAFVYPTGIGALSHAWSLSVEEQFYIIWPIVFLILMRLKVRPRRIVLLLAFAIIASALWRAFLWHGGAHHLRLYFGTDTRADALLIGCLAGALYSYKMIPKGRSAKAAMTILGTLGSAFLILFAARGSVYASYLYYGVFTVIALAASIIVLSLVDTQNRMFASVLEFAPLAQIGRISYGLYLWHYPVFSAIHDGAFGLSPLLANALRFGATLAIAILSFYFIEQPFLKLKSRFASVIKTTALRAVTAVAP